MTCRVIVKNFAFIESLGRFPPSVTCIAGAIGFMPTEINEALRLFIGLENSFDFDKKMANAWSSIQNALIGR